MRNPLIWAAIGAAIVGCAAKEVEPPPQPAEHARQVALSPQPAPQAPRVEPIVAQPPPPAVAHWKLLLRFSTLEDIVSQKGEYLYHATTASPYAVMSWARFEISERTDAFGRKEPHAFCFSVIGPKTSQEFDTVHFGGQMSGFIELPEAGSYTFSPLCQDRYAVEIYEPDPPDVRPSNNPPVPTMSGQQMQDLQAEARLQEMERHIRRIESDR